VSEFDPLLLSQVRLGVVTVLLTRKEASFTDLRSLLDLTQGNLGMHVQKLEQAGYLSTKKSFVKRMPLTIYRLTARGRRAFLEHVETLKRIADVSRPPG
jgi:DNA-binding MarR family transcriptional regulator